MSWMKDVSKEHINSITSFVPYKNQSSLEEKIEKIKDEIQEIEEEIEEIEKKKKKKAKRAGVIAYKSNGDIFVILQNVLIWSFPKGKIEGDEMSIDAASREFREESGYYGNIDLDEDKYMTIDNTKYYLFYINPYNERLIPFHIMDDRKEVIKKRWENINDFDKFRKENVVNKAISDFNIHKFLTKIKG